MPSQSCCFSIRPYLRSARIWQGGRHRKCRPRQRTRVATHPADGHACLLRELLEPLGTGGNLTSDTHLAALALEHGAELCSHDTDFARFPGLRWHDPLA